MSTSRRELQRRFLDLVESHQGIVHKVCALYATGNADRDDLRQEILMQAWRSYPSFRGDSRFSTWMYRVALNTALLRSRRTRPATDALPAEDPPAVSPPDPSTEVERLQLCIRRLPELDRGIILLYLEQHSHQEIAEFTGLSRKNVGVRIVRIKARLRECVLAGRSEER